MLFVLIRITSSKQFSNEYTQRTIIFIEGRKDIRK